MEELRGFARNQQIDILFRNFSKDIAENANSLCEHLFGDLVEPGRETLGWDETDAEAMLYWSELEKNVQLMPIPEDLDELGLQHLESFHSLWHTFHTALPFSEAERVWFLSAYKGETEPLPSQNSAPQFISHQEAHIISAGLREAVRGNELIRRWLAWSRETDEYTDQGTLGLAATALRELVKLFNVTQPLPDAPTAPE